MNELAIKENQIFSFPRFWQLLKSDFRINKPKYLRIAATIFGCFLTIAVLISIYACNDANSNPRFYVGDYVAYYHIACGFIFSLGLTVLGSLTFVSMNSKNGRISTLMMPASMLEKFVLRFLIYFVAGTLLLVIGYFIGALEIVLAIATKDSGLDFSIYGLGSDSFKEIISAITLPVVFGNALYALGSSIWPRSSWVKTWVMTQIVWVAGMFLTAFGFFNLFAGFFTWLNSIENIESRLHQLQCVYHVVFSLLIIICWALAWWRFRNTQIVQRFMKK